MFVIGRKLSNTKGMVTLGSANREPTPPAEKEIRATMILGTTSTNAEGE